MVIVRKAVHSALLLAVVMISLAMLYADQDAPFLFAVQIIVYTGAVLMLFLFVLMLVGVDSADSLVETIRGTAGRGDRGRRRVRRPAHRRRSPRSRRRRRGARRRPTAAATSRASPQLLFSRYVFAFEATSALLITAALGAMVLAHRERLTPKPTQRRPGRERMRDYAEHGKHPGPLPTPGVFARHNAVDTPALLPDGTPSELSVSRVMLPRHARRRPATSRLERRLDRRPTSPADDRGRRRR